MNTAFEQTVLAYLDGLLDRREERAFLKEVARDPSKRAILDQYRNLNATLRDRSTPIAVPLKTQQALAERIPALQEVVPRTVPTAAAGGGSGAAAFFSRKVMTLLIGGGLTIGTLTTVLLTDPFAAEEAARIPESHSMTAAENVDETPSAADAFSGTRSPSRDGEAMRDRAMRDAKSSSTAIGSEAMGSAAMESASAAGASAADAEVTSASMAHRRARKTAGEGSRTTVTAPAAASRDRHARTSPTESDMIAETEHAHAAVRSSITDAHADGSRELEGADNAALTLRAIPQRLPGEEHDWTIHRRPVTLFRDILDGRLYAYLETGASRQEMRGSGTLAKDLVRGVYLAGLRYDITPQFAAGLEFGQSSFAREGLVTSRRTLADGGGAEIIIVDRALQDALQPWLRLHGLYTFNPQDRLQLQADAGSGVLLGSSRAFIFSLGLSTIYPITYGLHARAGLHYSGTWLQPSGVQPDLTPSSGGVIGIIRRAESVGTVYTSSLELRIGFGVLLW